MKKIFILSIILLNIYQIHAQNSSETNLSGSYPILKVVGHGFVGGINISHRTPILGNTGSITTSNNTAGVVGYSANSSTSNIGVLGFANGNSSNENIGIYGQSNLNNATGIGVRGKVFSNSIAADFLYGGNFTSEADAGINGSAQIFGLNALALGSGTVLNSFGIFSASNANITSFSHGINALSNATGTGSEIGGEFEAKGTTTGSLKIGVLAKTSGSTSVDSRYGVQSLNIGPASTSSMGVYSVAENSGNGSTYGGYFDASGTGTGIKYGIYAKASGNGTTHAGWFDGRVSIGSSTSLYQLGITSGTNTTISTTGYVGIGQSNSQHITLDGDDIDAWNNTSGSTLFINYNSQSGVQIGRASGSNILSVAGEIQRPQTTDANLVPIAYGTISPTGSIALTASTNNFTSNKTNTGTYEIVITGENYTTATHLAITTLSSINFGFMRVAANNGKLQVYTADTTGTSADIGFSFAVYKK